MNTVLKKLVNKIGNHSVTLIEEDDNIYPELQIIDTETREIGRNTKIMKKVK